MRLTHLRGLQAAMLAAALLGLVPVAGSAAPAARPGPALPSASPIDDISGATVGPLPLAVNPTATVRAEPAASPGPEASDEPSEPVAPTPPASETPTPTPSEPSTTTAPPPSEPTETTTSPEASPSASADWNISFSGLLPVMLGIGALLALVGLVGWLLAGSARKRRWDQELEVERVQARWVTGELVPALANPVTPVHEIVGHWAAAQPTVDALQTNLAHLASQAPDDRRAAAVALMSTSSAQVRSSAAALLSLAGGTAPDPQAVASARAALMSASAQLAGASDPER